jgi:lauroyl/myristoyl acyltransferase
VILSSEGNLDYMRELLSVIKDEHGTVSIRGDTLRGRRRVEAPFLGAVAAFPTGAPSLAHRTGAPLLTTATIRRGPLDHEVIIDRPISVARDLARSAFQHAAVQEYASRLEQRIRDHPGSRPWLPVIAALQDKP